MSSTSNTQYRPTTRPPSKPLLVALDDERKPAEAISAVFKSEFDVVWLPRKAGFVDLVSRYPASAPAVVITDCTSAPMSGIQFLEGLRERGIHELFPVIVLTASSVPRNKFLELGAFEWMAKPFDTAMLREVVTRAHQESTRRFRLIQDSESVPLLNWTDPSRRRMAVLDDEESIGQSIRTLFREEFEVIQLDRKDGFLEAVTLYPDRAPDVVISDIRSPVLSGIGFLRQLDERGLRNLFPVIILSAYETPECCDQAWKLGCFDYMNKPFSIAAIQDAVGRAYLKSHMLRKATDLHRVS